MDKYLQAFGRLVSIMDELREKCPWDRKQTIDTLRSMTIEETYELADAIADGDWKGIKEELGDLLLHILFYSKIGFEQKQFELDEMINAICEKLIRRHPHIYGDVTVQNDEDVKKNWESIKLQEGKKSVLSGVPDSLPAMVKAYRLQEKSKQVGFEWEHQDQVWEKVKEEELELMEVIEMMKSSNKELEHFTSLQKRAEEEFGDLLFSMINFARFIHIDPELALERTNKKFMKRFKSMEMMSEEMGRELMDMNLDEKNKLWEEAKIKG